MGGRFPAAARSLVTSMAGPAEPVFHPQPDEQGRPVRLYRPSTPTTDAAWTDPAAIATVIPGGPLPPALAGIPFARWGQPPADTDDWLALVPTDLAEPPPRHPTGKSARGRAITVSGVICQEPDGRIWVVHPSNRFAGYGTTFPKGQLDRGLNLAANAIKEAWEETGLRVELQRFLFDVDRGSAWARYYLARRIGGSPAAMGWESQSVSLCPIALLAARLDNPKDHETGSRIAALLSPGSSEMG